MNSTCSTVNDTFFLLFPNFVVAIWTFRMNKIVTCGVELKPQIRTMFTIVDASVKSQEFFSHASVNFDTIQMFK